MVSKFSNYPSFFRKKKKEQNCKDLGVGKDLMEFAKIPHAIIFGIYIYIYLKKNCILRILIRFNGKS